MAGRSRFGLTLLQVKPWIYGVCAGYRQITLRGLFYRLVMPSPHPCPAGRGTGRGVETPGARNWGSPDRGMPVKKNEEEGHLRG